jgi:tRNA(fMet)-specific endonuclease VapC
MSRVLLDTSAYSAFMRGKTEAVSSLRRADEIVLTPVVLGELKAGFLRGEHLRKNEAELARFLASPRVRLVGIDRETSERYAVILNGLRKAGTPIPTNALWLAASAMQHGLGVLTSDPHFLKVPQVIVDLLPQ